MTSTPHLDDDAKFQLGIISGKLDLLLVQNAEADRRNAERHAKTEEALADHDQRISSLEQGRSWVLGGAAAITAALGGLATWAGFR